MQHIQFGDGRIVYNPAEYGYEYHYYHKDHLGNIRQVFRAESTTTYMATMEPENETQEMQQFFHNLSDSRSIDARYNQTEGGRAVAWLDASRGRDYGPVWSKELAHGDSLHAAVLGMLYDPKEKPKLKDLLTGIGRQNTLRTGLEGANLTGTSSLGLQPLWLALQLARQLEKAPLPESYLGYILYDQDSIRYDSGRVEISRSAFTNPEELALDITATQGGFVEVYVYNASSSPVWYDQFSISSSQAVIIQENHYYPFGMQIAGLELDLDSKNRYLYNGKELQDDHDLDWHDYGARMYDAQIGRWHVVDPMAEMDRKSSPYVYVFNNPLSFIDPDGRFGDYYNIHGSYLGSDGVDDNKVYVADGISSTDDGKTSFDNARELSITHSEFQTISAIVKHEAGTSNLNENLWIAHTANNAANQSGVSLYDKLMSGYSSAPNNAKVPLSTSESSTRADAARAGVLDVLSNGVDPTGGSNFWDGTDFLAWGLNSPYADKPHAKFRQYNNISISGDIYNSYLNGALAKYPKGRVLYSGEYYEIPASVFSNKSNWEDGNFNYDTGNKRSFRIEATGAFGHSIFWKRK